MKLKMLLRSFDFDDVFPIVTVMYPNAKRHRKEFQQAFDMLCEMRETPSRKTIRYELMESPGGGNVFFGANDVCFRATWDVLVGKDVKKGHGVDLSDEEVAANCLINAIFIGKHPEAFEESYIRLTR